MDRTSEKMYQMRMNGATYQEIADFYGVSRQRVHQRIGLEAMKSTEVRGCRFVVKSIVYDGIYEYNEKLPYR